MSATRRASVLLQHYEGKTGWRKDPAAERAAIAARREKAAQDTKTNTIMQQSSQNQPDPRHAGPAQPQVPGSIGQHVQIGVLTPKLNNPTEFKKEATKHTVFVPGERMPGYQFSGSAAHAKYEPTPEPGSVAPLQQHTGPRREIDKQGGWGAGVKPLKSSSGNVGTFGQRADSIRSQIMAAQGKPEDPRTPYSSLHQSPFYHPAGHPAVTPHIPQMDIDFATRGGTGIMLDPSKRGLPSWRGMTASAHVGDVSHSGNVAPTHYDISKLLPNSQQAKAMGHKPTWKEEYTPDPKEMRYGNWSGNKPEVGVRPASAGPNVPEQQHVTAQSRRLKMTFDKKTGMIHSKGHDDRDIQVHHTDVLNKTQPYNDFLRHFHSGHAEIHDDMHHFAQAMAGEKAKVARVPGQSSRAATMLPPVMHAKPESPAHTTTTHPAVQGTHHEQPTVPAHHAPMSRAMGVLKGIEKVPSFTPKSREEEADDAYNNYNPKTDKTPKVLSPAAQAMLDRIRSKGDK